MKKKTPGQNPFTQGRPAEDELGDGVLQEELLHEEEMAMLLRNAGPRQSVPADIKRQVFQKTEQAWKVTQRRRRARRRLQIGLVAALLAVAAGLAFLNLGPGQDPSPEATFLVATVEEWFGDPSARRFKVGDGFLAETEVTTLESERVALRLGRADGHGGISLRLGGSTRVRLLDGSTVELLSGVIYVDTERSASEAESSLVEIRTPFGTATDIGTQFEAKLEPGQLRVRVREGQVRVASGGQALVALAGGEATAKADGALEYVESAPQEWAWAIEAAPSRRMEGRSLAEILRWVERETGWEVRYQDVALAEEVEAIRARGSLAGLRPSEIPEILLPTAGLEMVRDGEVLWIRRLP